jgi:hypothetical protein
MSVQFDNIKSVVFINKSGDYVTVKSSEAIVKSYRSIILLLRFFLCKIILDHESHKNVAIRFYQDLYSIVSEKCSGDPKYLITNNSNCDIICWKDHSIDTLLQNTNTLIASWEVN